MNSGHATGPTLVTGFARIHGISRGHRREQRRAVLGVGAEGDALSGAVQRSRASRSCFLQNVTGFMVGRQDERGGIAKDGAKMVHAVANSVVPQVHGRHRRLVRRRQLQHERARVRSAVSLDVAERAHFGDGRRNRGHCAEHRQARPDGARGEAVRRRQRSTPFDSPSWTSTRPRARRTTQRPGCGTTGFLIRWRPGLRWRARWRWRFTRPFRRRSSACSGCR